MQKLLFIGLIGIIAYFYYQLYYGKGGIYDRVHLTGIINQQIELNKKLTARNLRVIHHLEELKGSPELLEARARNELNLIKPNEILVLLPQNNNH